MTDIYPKSSWIGVASDGQFNFNEESCGELAFNKTERRTVMEDPNWVKACNSHGQDSVTPLCHAPESNKESSENSWPWFRGKISREEAEKQLSPRENGSFLVRESTNFPGDYTLCVCFQDKVEHYRIISKGNKLTVDEEVFFDHLGSLVEHYENDADGLCTNLIKEQFYKDSNEFKKWSIDRRHLKLTDSIGKGEFGDVHLGDWLGKKVAVKGHKGNSPNTKNLLKEAFLMMKLNHPNLVSLLGIVWDESSILLVTEYMSKGSLVDYLRTRGRLLITKKNQINFACDTANGMAYLESMNVIHRDLAARNVLLSDQGSAKVCDFGLAQSPSCKLDRGKFPIKWTAPEALRQHKFTNKSDMWSYGVLLWEIYSFGRVPYPRILLLDIIKYVEKGNRMEPPDDCPSSIYKIMIEAWSEDPDCRPAFKDVYNKLAVIRKQTS